MRHIINQKSHKYNQLCVIGNRIIKNIGDINTIKNLCQPQIYSNCIYLKSTILSIVEMLYNMIYYITPLQKARSNLNNFQSGKKRTQKKEKRSHY